jgi:YD repeat-containing protein
MINMFLPRLTYSWMPVIAVLLLGSPIAWADTLAETREVRFECPVSEPDCEEAQIADKATELATPAAIYEYVRNNFDYALYHGSRQNSLNTYLGKRGSDVDIASVLIAMYRSQNIPARYAKGTVRALEADVMNWLGVKDLTLAKAIMRDQGIQNVGPYPTHNGQYVEFEHAWVQVKVPYSDYRGAFQSSIDCSTANSACIWVDIDPSFKLREYHNQNIDIYNDINFEYTAYYNAIANDDSDYRDKNPLEIYEEQIIDYLATYRPGKTLEDVADPGTIIPARDSILPASLPYQVTGTVTTYDSVADHDSANNPDWAKYLSAVAEITDLDSGTPSVGQFCYGMGSYALADLSTKRLTLSYNADLNVIWTRLDGIVTNSLPLGVTYNAISNCGVGTTRVDLQAKFNLRLVLDGAPSIDDGADGTIEALYENLLVGGYYLIGSGGDTSNWSQVHRAADQLLQANEQFPIIYNASESGCDTSTGLGCTPYFDANDNGSVDSGEDPLLGNFQAEDALTGGLLNVAMTQYFARFRENIRRFDNLNHVTSPIEGFVGVVSSTDEVEYLGNTAFSVMPGGLLIDMKGQSFSGLWRIDASNVFANDHFELVGHSMSSLEHEIWQEITGFDAISTVRGLQMARAAGTQLVTMDDGFLPTAYTAMGFSSTPPDLTSFTMPFGSSYVAGNTYSQIAKTFIGYHKTPRPAIYNYSFEAFKEEIDASTSSLRRAIATYPVSSSSNLAEILSCYYSNIADLYAPPQEIRTSWNSNQTNFSNGYTNCFGTFDIGGGAFYSYLEPVSPLGQSANSLYAVYANNFYSIITNPSIQALIDYFTPSEGFIESWYMYRRNQGFNEYSTDFVVGLRDLVSLTDWQLFLPAEYVNTGFNRFAVRIDKQTSGGDIARLSFLINNAGGGYVDGLTELQQSDVSLSTSAVLPEFENEVFTDENLVAVTNNDLVRTPSTIDPVSTVTGNMYHDETDIIIKGRGLPYVFTRSYNSGPGRVDQDGPLGFGWTHSYNMSLRSNDYGKCPNCTSAQASENDNNIPSSISYIDERGGEHTYILNADGAGTRSVSENPPGEFESLQFNTPASGQHTLAFRNGVKYVFEEVGSPNMLTTKDETARLKYIEDAYNNRLNLTYDGSGRLSQVRDNLAISGRTGLTFTYSGSSTRIQSVRDWTNRTWTFAYDGSSNLDSMTNPLSDVMDYTYHAGTHLLNEIIHPQLRSGEKKQMAFAYYRNNKAFNYVNTLGETETLDYDLYRQRTQVTDPRGFIRTHFYDKDNGALVKLKEPDGAILQFDNNADGLRYNKRDGLGFLTQYSFQADRSISANASNNNGLVSREIDALSNNVDYNYGIYDQPTTITDKRGNVSTRSYYASTNAGSDQVAGKLSEVRTTLNGTPNVLLESYTYYASGAAFGQLKQKIEYIDPANSARQRITNYVYESNGINLQSMTVTGATAGGAITTNFTYDNLGRVETQTLQRRTSATDATLINLTTTYTYDNLGRVTQVETPRGDIQETVYDDNGKITTERVRYLTSTARPNCAAPSGGYVVCTYTQNTYDAADRLIQTTDILGNSTSFEYDALGNLIKQTDANNHSTHFEYDGMNRRTAIINANGYRTEFKYDLAGRLIETKDANGHTVTNTFDALGRLTQVTSEEGRIVQTQFDANGNPTHSIDANAVANGLHPRNNQNASIYREYDEFNRLILERDALNGDTTYSYNLLGNITSITDAEGQVTTFVYDDLGRLTQTIDPVIEAGTDRILQRAADRRSLWSPAPPHLRQLKSFNPHRLPARCHL